MIGGLGLWVGFVSFFISYACFRISDLSFFGSLFLCSLYFLFCVRVVFRSSSPLSFEPSVFKFSALRVLYFSSNGLPSTNPWLVLLLDRLFLVCKDFFDCRRNSCHAFTIFIILTLILLAFKFILLFHLSFSFECDIHFKAIYSRHLSRES